MPLRDEEDKKLYKEFLEGRKESFEKLIMKYKSNLIYFAFKYVKNKDAAEDIFQDTVLYLLDKKEIYNFQYSFKSFVYTAVKSRALNYIRNEKRKDDYIKSEERLYIEEKLLEDIVLSDERQKKIRNVINKMSDEYQMVIYLAVIEDLSYAETAGVMNKTVSQVKNLLHRAKVKLRKLLISERVVEMKGSRVIRLLAWFAVICVITSGVVYAAVKIYENINGKAEMTPTFTGNISSIDTNKLWVGTFNLVWNDFMNDVVGGPVQFEDGTSELADELNKQTFQADQLNENSYYKVHGQAEYSLKEKAEKDIKEKFGEESKILEKIDWGNPNVYVLYSMLKKEFTYPVAFPDLKDDAFGNSEEKVRYFGMNTSTENDAIVNIEVLFYNNENDFAVKLKTKEGEEVVLYKSSGKGKSFEMNYNEMLMKQKNYSGEKAFRQNDNVKIPYIKVDEVINYDELCGRYVKDTDYYIRQALQTVKFELNSRGGSVQSEAASENVTKGFDTDGRNFSFDDDFILFLKEENKDNPYLALKVDNTDVLVKASDNGNSATDEK